MSDRREPELIAPHFLSSPAGMILAADFEDWVVAWATPDEGFEDGSSPPENSQFVSALISGLVYWWRCLGRHAATPPSTYTCTMCCAGTGGISITLPDQSQIFL